MARGYNSYRGRKSIWKTVVAGLLVLIILAAAGVMLLQRFVVYDDMGVPQLSLPAPGKDNSQPPTPGEVDITIQENVPEPEAPVTQMQQAVQLGGDPTLWTGELALADQDAFCVTVKSGGGQLQYPFATGAAGQVRSSTAAAAEEALHRLLDGEAYSIARLSCLWDGSVARSNVETMGLKNTGGFLFYDGNNTNWLDPAKEATRAYLCALAVECADMGFDEILLTELSYPTEGKLNKIAYGDPGSADQFDWNAEQMAGLVADIREALGERPVKLSLEVPVSVLENGGVDAVMGLDLQQLLVDGVYVRAEADRMGALRAAIPEGVTLTPEVTAVPAEDMSYLLLPQV